ncbi:MAG: hypothetical protein N2712_03605 [Brevinematales bacterium]|nr:hypothetical protein [Brevinematales bacterium]
MEYLNRYLENIGVWRLINIKDPGKIIEDQKRIYSKGLTSIR